MNKAKAKKRKINFELNLEEFSFFCIQDCFYCEAKPYNLNISHCKEKYQGIDRINNDKGYENSNCLPCCKDCNSAKSNLNQYDFILHLKRIKYHQNQGLGAIP